MAENDAKLIYFAEKQIDQRIKELLKNLQSDCLTYGEVSKKLDSVKRQFCWDNTKKLSVAIVARMQEMVEQEKDNSKISGCL